MSPTHRVLALAAGSVAGVIWLFVGIAALRASSDGWMAVPLLLAIAWAVYAVSDMNYQLSKSDPKPRETPPEW